MHSTRSEIDRTQQRPHRSPGVLIVSLLAVLLSLTISPSSANASTGWELILDRPTPAFGGMDFVSEDEGWLVAGAGLLHTTDGGATWEEAAQLSGTDVDFADADHGWLVGPSGAIYGTTDGGETWEEQDSGTNVHLSSVVALSPNEALAIGFGAGFGDDIEYPLAGAFLLTTDGGATWGQVETPPDSWFREITIVGDSGWALGSGCSGELFCNDVQDLLIRSSDRGASWQIQSTDLPFAPRRLVFVNDQEGWIVGHLENLLGAAQYLFHTNDGGQTWSELFQTSSGQETVADLAFQDEGHGWMQLRPRDHNDPTVRLLTTDDGGVTWRETGSVPAGGAQFANQPVGQDIALYAFGASQRSLDGGVTWQSVRQPALSLTQIEFVDSKVGFAIGSPGGILKTMDSGLTWEALAGAPPEANSIAFVDVTTGFAVSTDCCHTPFQIHRTTDGGRTWTQTHTSDSFALSSLLDAEFNDNRGWLLFHEGVVVTDDRGVTWTERSLESDWRFIDAAIADEDSAWALLEPIEFGETPGVVRTNDGGQTWTAIATGSAPVYGHRIETSDDLHAWFTTISCEESNCSLLLLSTSNGGANWQELEFGSGSAMNHSMVFTDALNGWINIQDCYCADGLTRIVHTTDGGLTWQNQLSDNYIGGATLYIGDVAFVDAATGWFLLDQFRGWGPGGGPDNRTQLFRTTDGGGGITVPAPTAQLPKVGFGIPDSESRLLPLTLLAAGLALSLVAAGLALARHARRP